MKNRFLVGAILLGTVTAATLTQMSPAQAYTLKNGVYSFNFTNKGSSDTVGDGYVNEFKLTLEQFGSGNAKTALFKLINLGTSGNRFIGQVAFNYKGAGTNPLTGSLNLNQQNVGQVSFKNDNNPNLSQFWQPGDAEFGAVFDKGQNGVHKGETLGLALNYTTDTLADLASIIDKHDLDVGIHVQGLPNDGSDSYTTIPSPALLPGLIGFGVGIVRKKRRAAQVAQDA